MPTVRFDRRGEDWVVLGNTGRSGDSGELVLMQEELGELRATDVNRALASSDNFYEYRHARALIAAVPEPYFDEGPYQNLVITGSIGRLHTTITHVAEWREGMEDDEDTILKNLRQLVEPYISARGGKLEAVETNYHYDVMDIAVDVQFSVATRGKTMQEVHAVTDGVRRLCEAFSVGVIDRASTADLIRGGAFHLLEGQPEGAWLEVKSQEYDLATVRGTISLAHAVARFCNAEFGGVLLIGAQTRKFHGEEIIQAVRGVTTTPGRPARYQQVLNHRLYPPPFALSIEQLATPEGRSLIVIDIPPQPEELKPFLVHGAILPDGSTEGAFISIVQRRGEGSIPITAPMIHATLVAGRALLRGTGPTPGSD